MRISFLVYCVVLCVALGPATVVGQEGVSTQPTVGGDPAFATQTDVVLATINNLIQAKDYEGAEKLAEELTSGSPGIVDAWMMLGYARSLTGKFEASNAAYDHALEVGADRIQVFTRKAYNCRKLGDVEKTRECYRSMLEVDAENTEILMQFGKFEASVDNFEEAAEVFDTVLRLQPDHMGAIESIAAVEDKLGNDAQVKYWIEQGLASEPGNTKLLKKLSLIYLNEQNYTLSIHYLKRLLGVAPDDAAAHRNLGIAQYQQGEKSDAKASFEKVRQLGGSMTGLYGPLADCYRSTGARGSALATIKAGIEAGDQEAWLYSLWGKLLEDAKQYDAAIAKFNKAVALKDEPWSGYARKQISRQAQLKKREAMIAAQGAME